MYNMMAKWLLRHASTYIVLLIFMPSPFVTAFGIPDFLEFGGCADTKIQPNLDLYRYSGVWFTQEMVPNEYTKIAACSMNNYTYTGDIMTVVERGLSEDNRKVRSNSLIRRSDDGKEGRLTVDAESVPSAPFEVIATDYENYACAYSCMSFMGFRAAFSWVYTRQPEPDQTYLVLCRSLLSEQGIDPTPLKPVKQGKDCPYMDKLSRVLAYSESVQAKAKAKAQEKAKTLKVSSQTTTVKTAGESTDSTLNEEVQRLEEMERKIQNEEEQLLQEMEEERQRQQEERQRMEEERQREQEERRRMEASRQGEQEERRRLEEERRIIEEQRTRLEEESRITKQERKQEKEALVELRDDVRAEIRRNHRGSRHRSDDNIAENSSSHLYNNGIATTVLLSLSLAALMNGF